MFDFQYPWLLTLLALPFILALLKGGKGHSGSIRFSSTRLLGADASIRRSRPLGWLTALRILALLLMIIALARPRLGEGYTDIESSGVDIILVVDASDSMRALDFKIKGTETDRITVVKKVVKDFVDKRPNDRMGLVAFATEPYLVSPLTLNHDWLQKSVDRLEIGVIPENATAIGSALVMGVNRLKNLDAKTKIVILLTDGENNAGEISPEIAAEAAAALGVKVYTIGAGKEGRVKYPLKDRRGRTYYREFISHIDEATLNKMAETTGGKFYRAQSTQDLESIYEDIDQLEKTEVKLRNYTTYQELFLWPLIAGLAILLLEQLLASTRLRSLP